MPAAVPSAAKLCRCSQQGLRGRRRAFGGGRATATGVDPCEALEQPAAQTCPRLHVLFAHTLPQAACIFRPQPGPQRRWRAARAGSMRVPPLPSACPPACFWLPTHAAPPHPLTDHPLNRTQYWPSPCVHSLSPHGWHACCPYSGASLAAVTAVDVQGLSPPALRLRCAWSHMPAAMRTSKPALRLLHALRRSACSQCLALCCLQLASPCLDFGAHSDILQADKKHQPQHVLPRRLGSPIHCESTQEAAQPRRPSAAPPGRPDCQSLPVKGLQFDITLHSVGLPLCTNPLPAASAQGTPPPKTQPLLTRPSCPAGPALSPALSPAPPGALMFPAAGLY